MSEPRQVALRRARCGRGLSVHQRPPTGNALGDTTQLSRLARWWYGFRVISWGSVVRVSALIVLVDATLACGGRTQLLASIGNAGNGGGTRNGQTNPDTGGDARDVSDTTQPPEVPLRSGRWLTFAGSRTKGSLTNQLFGLLLDDKIGELQVLAEDVGDRGEWSADGRFLAYSRDGEVRVLEHVGRELRLRRTLTPGSRYSTIAWSPVFPVLAWEAAVGGQEAVFFCDVGLEGQPVAVRAQEPTALLKWSADGRYLVVALNGHDPNDDVPALVDTTEALPAARALVHGGDWYESATSGFTADFSLDGRYVEYEGTRVGALWIAPLSQLDAAREVQEIVWQKPGGFVEMDKGTAARHGEWTGTEWNFGPWTPAVSARSVSVAGYVATSCDAGLCVGRVEDGQVLPWGAPSLFITSFSPSGRAFLGEELLVPRYGANSDQRILYVVDLEGNWGNLTEITQYNFMTGSYATSERWSPTSDSFVAVLEGGTAGVLAWRLGGSAGTFIAAPDPHRYLHSLGAWSPDGRDLVMAWGDDRATEETILRVFRFAQAEVVDQSEIPGFVRPGEMFYWRWQP